MNRLPAIENFKAELVAWRHDIHAHPETAFEEVRTASLVSDALKAFGLEVHDGIARTGVVGVLRGKKPGPSYGLRADMDALHIQEESGLPYASKYPGKMHACGHDGHTAMLLGAARYLAAQPPEFGIVYFIFQPAEENEGGARVMLEEGLLDRFPINAVFGMHNFPALPVGSFSTRSGDFLAAYDSFHITIRGSGSHAAMPEDGVDPILIGVEIVQAIQKLITREISALKPTVVSVTKFQPGDVLNASPDGATVEGSCRYFDLDVGNFLETRLAEIAGFICDANHAKLEFKYVRRNPPLINEVEQTDIATSAAAALVGEEHVNRSADRVMGSEDFAYFLLKKPGNYIFIGGGHNNENSPPCTLHNPEYDFNDEILTLGASYWVKLVEALFETQTS